MKSADIQQPAMRIDIPAVATVPTETTDGFYRLREWQNLCFNQLRSTHNWIITAPMAAGKSFEICAIAVDRLIQDDTLKVLIAVPQTIIAAGFRFNKIELPDGTRVVWEIQSRHDLCGEKLTQSTRHLIKMLLTSDSSDIMDRVILCTHATLVRAFAKNQAAFKKVLVVIDEAHHVKYGGNAELDTEIENQLGAMVKHSLRNPELIQLGLSTATFFRGDAAPIVPDLSRFARFELACDEYLATCKYLRSFSYDFVTHSTSFVDPLARLFAQRIGKTLVYIPPVGTDSSLGSKAQDVDAVLRAIAGTGTDAFVLADEDQPIMRVRRGGEWIKVVNLVDERLREQKKQAIIAAHEKENASDIDVIIALGMFKEGANWRWADREVIIGRRSSLTEIIQMIGRLLRDVAGKNHVEVYQLLPFALDQIDKNLTRENLNGYLTAILLSMLLENVLDPVCVPTSKGRAQRGEGEGRVNYLRRALGDDAEAFVVLDEIKQRVLAAAAGDSSAVSANNLHETFREIVSNVLSTHGVREYHDEATQQVIRMFSRRTVALQGLAVGHVEMDLVQENPFGCLLQYASDVCGVKTFGDLRAASRTRAFRSFENARAFVRALQLKSVLEWYEYCASGKKPDDIPSNPNVTYATTGWVGHSDWLGTGKTVGVFRPFHEARQFVRGLQLKSKSQWDEYCRSGEKPADISSAPAHSYRDKGWQGWGDWLGTGTIATFQRKYRPFHEARSFVHGLHLNSLEDWNLYCKSGEKPGDIPAKPSETYKNDGWKDAGDWLGTGRVANGCRQFRSFQDARRFVHSLGLQSQVEWMQYCRSGEKPVDIPSSPARTYRDYGWDSVGDWLGTGRVARKKCTFRPFQEARQFVHALKLQNHLDWCEYCKSGRRPIDIPSAPAKLTKIIGWKGLADWLGTKATDPIPDEGRESVRSSTATSNRTDRLLQIRGTGQLSA